MRQRLLAISLVAGAMIPLASAAARADEGMWLVNKPPVAVLKERHGFAPTAEWMEKMQKSAVRVGASGSLVSPDGLVMTNHHVAARSIQKLSTKERDLMTTGFYAKTRAEELKVPDGEITVLQTIEDVTAKMAEATKGLSPADANAARLKAIADLEKAEQEKTGLTCRVVTLYGGGQYHLYRSKRYTDIRLVFAPELGAAFFGGDTDNFEYPRFCLDAAFFRIYENDQPLKSEHYLKWSSAGSKEGDLALIFGHPGRTQRLLTVDHLKFVRDVEAPAALASLWRNEVKLQSFTGRSVENARIAGDDLVGVANGRKARTGQLGGLQDPTLFNAKVENEQLLRSAIAKDPALAAQVGDAFDRWSKALQEFRPWQKRYAAMNRGLGGTLASYALTIARLADELPKPSGQRLREYRDSALPQVRRNLESAQPTYINYEVHSLARGLEAMIEQLGGDDPMVVALLAGQSPQARAQAVIGATKLADPAVRKALSDGGKAAVDAAKDPLIAMVMAFDGPSRELRKRYEDQVEAVEREVYGKLATARFAAFGESTYPDATGTLRMSFGPIKGYAEEGQAIPAYSTIGGLFDRASARAGEKGFALPASWAAAKDKLDLSVPFNFVCTADIIGGNSGSPVVNTKGEVIGLIFDGNSQSLPWAYQFSETQGRAVAVDSRAIIEALRKVYGADGLAKELLGQ